MVTSESENSTFLHSSFGILNSESPESFRFLKTISEGLILRKDRPSDLIVIQFAFNVSMFFFDN